MQNAQGVDVDLGWALGSVVRFYRSAAAAAVAEVPGGVRGYLVLKISSQGEPSSQLALAQHLGVDRTVMTYLLDDLEQAGLVERHPDPVDRRARRVVLTGTGRTVLQETRNHMLEAEAALLEPLDADGRDAFRTLLQRLATTHAPAHPCEIIRTMVTGADVVAPVAEAAAPRRRRRAAPRSA